jgi:hypothetical protein
MQNESVFIAYAPRGAGLRCLLGYLSSGSDAYGWFTGPRHDMSIASGYFLLEGVFGASPVRYDTVDATALHSRWALDEKRRHEVATLQQRLAAEWLFRRDDARAAVELATYAEAELAAGELNLRFERLAQLDTRQPNWTYYSAGFQRTVLRHLAARWPLEFMSCSAMSTA